MGEYTFIPFADKEENRGIGGSDYGQRILRTGRNTFSEKHGCTAAFVIRWDSRVPCPRCRHPLLEGQYGRFHRDYGDELVHDGCADPISTHTPKHYVVSGARKPPLCEKCWLEHVGECP